MPKQIKFDEKARHALLKGMDILSKTVRATIGPRGRNVALDKGFGAPTLTNDGVTIAKEIELKDKFENMGAQLLIEVASKTNDVAGDGTTTAVILAHSIIEEGLKNVAAGANPLAMKRGIDKGVDRIVSELKKIAQKVTTKEETTQVATISGHDPEIGNIIAETMDKVGKEGVITVEEYQGFGLEKEFTEGMQFDKGFISPYMITNPERMEAGYENPYILITDKKISAVNDILPLLESMAKIGKKDLVIICDGLEGEALATLVVNKLRGTFNALAVESPGFGDRKKEMLQDIAILTGGQVVSEELGLKLENVKVEQLGKARRVVSTKDNTTIVEGKGKKSAIEDRIGQIKTEIAKTESDFDKEKLQERLAKLTGGVAVIKVGAASEVEQKEKQHRVEDALAATRAAVEEGIVPGGGVALIRCVPALDEVKTEGLDEKTAIDILRKSLEGPAKQIARNSGKEGSVIVEQIKKLKGNEGYNAEIDKFEDLVKAGIIDPVKVTRSALQNAASVASMFLTTEAVVAELPEEKEEKAPPMPPGGGMGM